MERPVFPEMLVKESEKLSEMHLSRNNGLEKLNFCNIGPVSAENEED